MRIVGFSLSHGRSRDSQIPRVRARLWMPGRLHELAVVLGIVALPKAAVLIGRALAPQPGSSRLLVFYVRKT